MKKRAIIVAGMTGALVLGGCGQSTPSPLNDKECTTLEKKMMQADTFIKNVTAMDPAHAEEMMAAVPKTEITTAMTKPKMLRDAKRRKAKLEAAFNDAGCKKSL